MPPRKRPIKKEPIPPQQMPQEILEELRICRDAADMALAAYGESIRRNNALEAFLRVLLAGGTLPCSEDGHGCYYKTAYCLKEPGNQNGIVRPFNPAYADYCAKTLVNDMYESMYTPVPEDPEPEEEVDENTDVVENITTT